MRYIIHGATGAQGAPLIKIMFKEGHNAIAAVRDTLAYQNIFCVTADMSCLSSLITAYEGADGIFVHLPLGPEEQRFEYAQNISRAVKIAKPKRVVVSTSGWDITNPDDKSALSSLIRNIEKSGTSMAVIATTLYLENLLLPIVLNTVMAENIFQYPLRPDHAASWCSHLDVAYVAAELLTKPHVSGIVWVGQLPAVTPEGIAKSFSKHFGRNISYKSLKPEEFGQMLVPLIGLDAASEVVKVYESKALQNESEINEERSAQKLLGLKPHSVSEWLIAMGI
ncbi:MAG TPA: NmrA family NAD(P)-binding protein [Methanosarcina sp.]|nr:NmrA family NAD(P)-binding protein [Methanosarcina sp.]